jgi:O-antigen/teichoic acid export membrane protein
MYRFSKQFKINDVASVAIGTGLGQLVMVAATPLLAVNHTPKDFGEYALTIAFINIVLAVGCLRYDLALASCKQEDVKPLVTISFVSAFAFAVVMTLLTLIFQQQTTFQFLDPLLSQPFMIASGSFFCALYQAASLQLIRNQSFVQLAILRASQGVIFVLVAVFTTSSLSWAILISYIMPTLVMQWKVLQEGFSTFPQMITIAKSYSSFPLYSGIGILLDTLAHSTIIGLITDRFGLGASGHFAQIQRVIGAPIVLISISLGQVLLRQFAKLETDRVALIPALNRWAALMIASSAMFLLLVAIIGESILVRVLSPEWRVDQFFLIVISVSILARGVVSPLSAVLSTRSRLKYAMFWQVIYFVSMSILFPMLTKSLDMDKVLSAFAAMNLFVFALYWVVIKYAVIKTS